MFLPNANEQYANIKSMCENISRNFEVLKKSILNFANETKLKGKAYDSAKQYFNNTYIPLLNGFILLSNAIINANNQFIEDYKSQVDVNSLQSDVLENQIQRLQIIISELERISAYNSTVNFSCEHMLYCYRLQQKKIKEKLEKLLSYNGSSVKIFSEVEDLLSNVKKGILEISNGSSWDSSNNVFILNNSNSEWVSNLNKKFEEKELDLIISKMPNLTPNDLDLLKEYALKYPDEETPEKLVDILNQLGDRITKGGYISTANLAIYETLASIKKYKNGTWYKAPVKSTKTGFKTWKQVRGDVNRFKTVKEARYTDEILNGTGLDFSKKAPKLTVKGAFKSVGILGGVGAVLDGGTTYLERKDKYGKVSAAIDGVGHSATSIGAIYAGAAIGSAIPIPILGTITGAVAGAIAGNLFSSIWDEVFHSEEHRFWSKSTFFG